MFCVSNTVYILGTVSGLSISSEDFETAMCPVTDVCLKHYQSPCLTSRCTPTWRTRAKFQQVHS
jgi:hypothetical protein